jgi:hypothetical protein
VLRSPKQMAASSVAGAVLPVAVTLVGVFGVGVIGPFLALLASAMCLLYRWL